jgi:hypothetical protein
MYSTVVPIFRQDKSFESKNTGSYHNYINYQSNVGIDTSRILFTIAPSFAYLYFSTFQNSLLAYKKFDRSKIEEMIDRRVK